MKNLDNELIKFIISRWDGKNNCIHLDDGKKICITEEDVYRVYGLPRGPNVVCLQKTSKVNSNLGKDYGFCKTGKGTVGFENLRACMGAKKSDSRWVNMYVLMIFCRLFESVTSRTVTIEYLTFLSQGMVKYFCDYDWCGYVYGLICDKVTSSQHHSWVEGDMHFLLVCFLDRTTVNEEEASRCVSNLVPTS
ncbi:unnamed protein product [Linum trigynum]|uniref:Uncharacterized protein n=1 Tax=Linum trigynum TaxID=586398 RepID=A0AAV2E198_9ROSI